MLLPEVARTCEDLYREHAHAREAIELALDAARGVREKPRDEPARACAAQTCVVLARGVLPHINLEEHYVFAWAAAEQCVDEATLARMRADHVEQRRDVARLDELTFPASASVAETLAAAAELAQIAARMLAHIEREETEIFARIVAVTTRADATGGDEPASQSS